MKNFLFALLASPFVLFAQTYPFDEGFYGIASGTLPVGWSGDMKVQADHGLNDMKGMTADISGNDNVDSAITPWIGPLDNNTEFYFWYRMIDQFIYPSTPRTLRTNDKLIISYSTDSINYFPLYTIDSTNHQTHFDFKKVTFAITGLGGQIVKFKFFCTHGGGAGYFTDIDSIKVRLNTDTKIEDDKPLSAFRIYPNPANSGGIVTLQFEDDAEHTFSISDYTGRMIDEHAARSFYAINTKLLHPGVYFITSGNRTRRLIVQH
ncbi:MAG: T9SS type A sorting domain-containing protein [Chitinophagales bacterium]|nr:T9SS type A sorting domain-containing protein [Chitinophagales bacterium]